MDVNLQECYNKITLSAIKNQLVTASEEKWEREWESTSNGLLTKSFFPCVRERLKLKLRVSPNLTTLLTGHGRLNAYFHRFKIKTNSMCVYGEGDQTVDHVIYDCVKVKKEREVLFNQ